MHTRSNVLELSQALTDTYLHLKTSVVFCMQDKDRNDISDEHCHNLLKKIIMNSILQKIGLTLR